MVIPTTPKLLVVHILVSGSKRSNLASRTRFPFS